MMLLPFFRWVQGKLGEYVQFSQTRLSRATSRLQQWALSTMQAGTGGVCRRGNPKKIWATAGPGRGLVGFMLDCF